VFILEEAPFVAMPEEVVCSAVEELEDISVGWVVGVVIIGVT
jgi:hypothetical protein